MKLKATYDITDMTRDEVVSVINVLHVGLRHSKDDGVTTADMRDTVEEFVLQLEEMAFGERDD